MPRLSEEPWIDEGCVVENTTLGRYTQLCAGTQILNSDFGDYSYTAGVADIANATIGKFCNIASYVRIGATDHPMSRASQHHFLYRSSYYWDDIGEDAAFFVARRARRAVIGHDTWLGHASMVKPGVTVGHGAVVGAGAIVTKDVAPYAVVAGNPARMIRERHPPGIAARLMALSWWDWSHDRLRGALEDFRMLEAAAFLEKYEGGA
ncbi:MAG: chloramphenicol acetyltransferase [Pseudomonadota bacterium]